MPDDDVTKADEPTWLHTDLTTCVSLAHDRQVRHDEARVLMKSVPCGAICNLWIRCDYTMTHLYHLFCSASKEGMSKFTLFYLPTESGLIEMDKGGPAELACSQRFTPLLRYGLNKSGVRAVVFQGSHVSMSSMICKFVHSNLFMENYQDALKIMPHLDGSVGLLGADLIQDGLWDILTREIECGMNAQRQFTGPPTPTKRVSGVR